jgi:hypothetical protein
MEKALLKVFAGCKSGKGFLVFLISSAKAPLTTIRHRNDGLFLSMIQTLLVFCGDLYFLKAWAPDSQQKEGIR